MKLSEMTTKIYIYCTDFVITIANLSGLSYYEVNALIFCILYPILLIVLVVVYIVLKRKLVKLRKRQTLLPTNEIKKI